MFKEFSFECSKPQIGETFYDLSIEEIRHILGDKQIFGTHTYNRTENIEVIDVLRSKFTIIGLFGKIRTKLLKL